MINNIRLLSIISYILCNMSYGLLPIEHWKTPEGAKVYYIYAKEIPMLDIQIAINAGAFHEKTQYGLADLTAELITMGSDNLSEEDFALALENIGSTLTANAGNDTTILSLRTLTDENTLKTALTLLQKALTKPHFEANILKREVRNTLVNLESISENPDALANEVFMRTLYPNNRLGVDSKALQNSLPLIQSDDLISFFKTYYHANNAVIVLVGDIDIKRAQIISRSISQSLGKSTLKKQPYDFKAGVAQSINISFDTPQSTIILGHVGIDRFNPDYLALTLGNHILGGSGLNSILSQEVREKRGLTYGIYSGFSVGRYQGPFSISFSTKHASIAEGIKATQSILFNFIENGPTEEALTLAKNNVIGGFALNLDSNRKLASALLGLGMYDLPLDYYDTYKSKITKITIEDIKQAFKKHVHPQQLNTIIVGQAPSTIDL